MRCSNSNVPDFQEQYLRHQRLSLLRAQPHTADVPFVEEYARRILRITRLMVVIKVSSPPFLLGLERHQFAARPGVNLGVDVFQIGRLTA